jgi:hypothetical protein
MHVKKVINLIITTMKKILLFVAFIITGTILSGQKSIDALFDDKLKVDNFYDIVMKDIDLKDYEEFMRVKDSDSDLRMLVRIEGKKFKEFLLIAGGEDNALIQIKGDMTLNEAKKFSEDAKKKHGVNIMAEHE